MKSMLISFGHAFSHSPWFVHEPKYPSMVSTMFCTRFQRSGWPCGSRLRWATLAAVKSWAALFGHAATHAPQPMHAAASIAASATSFGTRIRLASGALPVGRGDETAGLDDVVERGAIGREVADHGEGGRPPGLDSDLVAVGELAQEELTGRSAA